MDYSINNINMDAFPGEGVSEIAALKIILSVVIFTLPPQQRDAVLRSISEVSEPSVERAYKQIMQFHPDNS